MPLTAPLRSTTPVTTPSRPLRRRTSSLIPVALFGGSSPPRGRPPSAAPPGSSVAAAPAVNRGALRLFLDSASVIQV